MCSKKYCNRVLLRYKSIFLFSCPSNDIGTMFARYFLEICVNSFLKKNRVISTVVLIEDNKVQIQQLKQPHLPSPF